MSNNISREEYAQASDLYIKLARSAITDNEPPDLGTAWYLSTTALNFSKQAEDPTITSLTNILVEQIKVMVELEFLKIAQDKGLKLTEVNQLLLFKEHSPSYQRFIQLTDTCKDLIASLKQGPDKFVSFLRGGSDRLEERLRNTKNTKYLADHIQEIRDWEEFKGDLGLDLEKCYSGLTAFYRETEVASDPGNLVILDELKEKLDQLKNYNSK